MAWQYIVHRVDRLLLIGTFQLTHVKPGRLASLHCWWILTVHHESLQTAGGAASPTPGPVSDTSAGCSSSATPPVGGASGEADESTGNSSAGGTGEGSGVGSGTVVGTPSFFATTSRMIAGRRSKGEIIYRVGYISTPALTVKQCPGEELLFQSILGLVHQPWHKHCLHLCGKR